jgi:16S rRNA (guanine1207-N2)-methyltransferase
MTILSYTKTTEFQATILGISLRVISKPGLPQWESVSPTAHLLAEAFDPTHKRVALLGCGHGALAVALAKHAPALELTLCDAWAIALAMAAKTLQANGVRGVQISQAASLLPAGAGQFDCVVIDQPQSRALARRWLAEAHGLLREGGILLLAGPNELGIQSVIDDADALFGTAGLLAYKRKCRVVRAARSAMQPLPGWATSAGIAAGTWHNLNIELAGETRQLASLPGVFAFDQLDAGTALLLDCMPDPHGLRVLDIGCGYGALGLAACLRGAQRVEMVDSNLLAVAAARENIRRLGVQAEALSGDIADSVLGKRYDLIVINPPFHVGKQVVFDVAEAMIQQSKSLLATGGKLLMVANRFIRHDRLLREAFGTCTTIADTGQYWVLGSS